MKSSIRGTQPKSTKNSTKNVGPQHRQSDLQHRASTTKDAILDTAERLFALEGLATIPLRRVAQEAGVDAASITYHFGDKADLLQAVIIRRYEMLREPRMVALMDVLDRTRNKPTVRDILDSLFRPWLERNLHGEIGWRYYSKLLVSVSATPKIPYVIDVIAGSSNKAIINALRLACPDTSDESLLWALCLAIGTSYFLFAEAPRIDAMSEGRFHAGDIERGYQFFLTFVSNGFDAIVNEQRSEGA